MYAHTLDRTGSPDHDSSHKLSQFDRDSKSWGEVANEGLPVLFTVDQAARIGLVIRVVFDDFTLKDADEDFIKG